jgi:mannitol operon transcriptional antiterminator
LEETFSILFSDNECAALALQIQSCRAKIFNPADQTEDKTKLIEELVFKMIRRFDPKLAPNLETNIQLIDGLKLHLGPAISRLEQKIELIDPLNGQIALWYPELYEKSRRASTVLQEYLQINISENEVSFIAAHFSAAYFSMDEKNMRKKLLRACLVCVSGIGVSYMLASQIRTRFKGELELDISGTDDGGAFDFFDFLISTIPLKTDLPVIQVNTMLTENDYQKIRHHINRNAYIKKDISAQNKNQSLSDTIETAFTLLNEVKNLLGSFSVHKIDADCTFDELVHFVSDLHDTAGLYEALKLRESISTQVIEDLKIVLLHTRTADEAVFSIISPKDKSNFTNEYFKGAASCVLMLLPLNAEKTMIHIMGAFSAALVDNLFFLDAVQNAREDDIRSVFEAEIAETLSSNFKTMFL